MKKPAFRLPVVLLIACAVFARVPGALAQDAAAPQNKSIVRTILDSGPLGVMIWCAILGASITMVTFVIQNILTLRNDRLAPPPLIDSLRQALSNGNYQEAWEICNANHNYLANTLKAGLERIGRGKDVFDDALAEHGLREAQMMRTRNSYLSVIGVVSPMIGLLGTVVGMMKAFTVLGGSGISDQQHRRGAPGHGERTLHRHPRLRQLLPLSQPRPDRDRQRRGPHQLPGGRGALRGTRGHPHRRELQRGRGRAGGQRTSLAARFHGAHHELPGVQRGHRLGAESLSPLRGDAGLEAVNRAWTRPMSEQRTKDKQRRKKNSVREMPEEDPDFQIAPMIDVLLVLLVFFMSISSTEVLQSTKGIELPVAAEGNDAAKNKHQVIVNVSWAIGTESGGITVDEKSYQSPAELTPFLQQRLQGDPSLRVLIRADKDTRYEFMRAVMFAIGQTAVSNVTFSVVDKDKPKVASTTP